LKFVMISPPFFLFWFSQLSKTDAIDRKAGPPLSGISRLPQD
jgi:hypothetical protein